MECRTRARFTPDMMTSTQRDYLRACEGIASATSSFFPFIVLNNVSDPRG
jgi:hypothetical protein